MNGSDPTGLVDITSPNTSASLWNHEAWMEGGSVLTSDQFDKIKQGLAKLVWAILPEGDAVDGTNGKSADSSPKQNQPGKPDYAMRSIDRAYPVHEGKIYWARMFWRIQLFHHKNQTPLGRGIQVREEIRFSEGFGFTAKDYMKGEQPTRDDGSVDDPWGLPFNRPDGHVKVTQTIFAGGREATWEAEVKANGEYDAQHYIPFHDSPP